MTSWSSTPTMWVAIDIAKAPNDVRIESPKGRRRHFRVANTLQDLANFAAFLSRGSVEVVPGGVPSGGPPKTETAPASKTSPGRAPPAKKVVPSGN